MYVVLKRIGLIPTEHSTYTKRPLDVQNTSARPVDVPRTVIVGDVLSSSFLTSHPGPPLTQRQYLSQNYILAGIISMIMEIHF